MLAAPAVKQIEGDDAIDVEAETVDPKAVAIEALQSALKQKTVKSMRVKIQQALAALAAPAG